MAGTRLRQPGQRGGGASPSNILNIFVVLGTTAASHPINTRPEIFHLEIPFMLVFSVGLLFLVFRGRRLVRWQGIMLTAGYIAFVMILLGRGTVCVAAIIPEAEPTKKPGYVRAI